MQTQILTQELLGQKLLPPHTRLREQSDKFFELKSLSRSQACQVPQFHLIKSWYLWPS